MQAGAEIRANADVAEIRVKDGVATGVVLASGEEISAKAVVSNADPKRTLMRLVDPTHLAPDFAQKIKNYRSLGTVAKINLALSGLPEFPALQASGNGNLLKGRIQISPEIDYLERAFDESKYGNFSRQPYLEITFPSLTDPSLAPAGQQVMSIYMQYAPYKLKNSDWESQRTALGEAVVKTITQYAPSLPQKILRHQIITPKDFEDTYGLTGGHIFHGELALDQFFTMRPLLDWARYQTPIEKLYLCGNGTHPGTGLTGGSGAYLMQYYAMAMDYPLNIGGRPLHSWPSFIPITFELTVLAAALSAIIGSLLLNGLPRLHHPVFNLKAFERASLDRFFLCIEADDPKFDREATRRFLQNQRPLSVEEAPA